MVKDAKSIATSESEGGIVTSWTDRDQPAALAKEEEHILRCLGAAVIMHWHHLPTDIQRELFEHAVSMGEPRHTAQLKEQIARFLIKHESDEKESEAEELISNSA